MSQSCVALLVAILCSGCTAAAPEPDGIPVLPEKGHLGFGAAVQPFGICPVVDCGSRANFEPTVAIGTGGILVASSVGPLARSTDGGATFQPTVLLPQLLYQEQQQESWLDSDQTVQTAPDGSIWMTMMTAHFVDSNVHSDGFFVARTTDAGLTWDHVQRIKVQPTTGSRGPDRQWLVFGQGRMLLFYQQTHDEFADAGFVIASTDSGVTWSPPVAFAPTGAHGRPAWTGDAFVAPYVARGAAFVATSADGADWRQEQLPGPESYSALGYPSAASDGHGNVWIVWPQLKDETVLALARSHDHGASWSEPASVAQGLRMPSIGAWIESVPSGVAVAFYSGETDHVGFRVELIHDGTVRPGGPDGVLDWGNFKATDFAHFATEGHSVLAIYSDAQRTIYVARST